MFPHVSLLMCLLVAGSFRTIAQQKTLQAPPVRTPTVPTIVAPQSPAIPRSPTPPVHGAVVLTPGDTIPGAPGERRERPDSPASAIFDGIRQGLVSGDVSGLSAMLAPQVSMTLRTGEHGYFSSNQAFLLVQHFLRTRKITNLNFSTMGGGANVPYATGSGTLLYRGNRYFVQVYVSLSRWGDRWMISQLNIY